DHGSLFTAQMLVFRSHRNTLPSVRCCTWKLSLSRLWGKTQRRFIRKPVPSHLAHLPNHITGEIAYVQGYRTW
ncbi:MAG: hypothetical protein VX836_19740, partial [Pseudomonadota bacterium]|nr:hypothetical protein [Pseudomonadota bacterium]